MRDKLLSVTINDCRVDTYRGSGKGGQKRNKTSSAVRIVHEPSGAAGQAEDGRSQLLNKRLAFGRMARTPEMQKWLRIESSRVTGELARIEKKVEREMRRTRVEIKSPEGRWVLEPAPSYVNPAPSYVNPAPNYIDPAPSYVAPAPSYVNPAPNYIDPVPSYVDPVPSYVDPE